MTPRLEKRHADGAQSCTALAYLKAAATPRSDQHCRERECRQYPGLMNEGVGEHVRTRFHVGPKAACEIAELSERRTAPNEENSFLLPDRERERSDR